jgi:hypothetical protein
LRNLEGTFIVNDIIKFLHTVHHIRLNKPTTLQRLDLTAPSGEKQRKTRTYCNGFNVHGSVHRKNILIYVQQDATLHSLLYLETALHVLGGTTTHHQEHKQLYLQHLVFVTPLLLPAAIMEELELV